MVNIRTAIDAAEEAGLDLVEVSPDANPPVCRIMDYGKFKYQQAKKIAEAKKNATKVEIKEVKMRPKTDDHDFQVKARNAIRFLEAGNKVKLTVQFRGREQAHPERGLMQIEKMVAALKDVGQQEMSPSRQGRFMITVFGPLKK